MYFNSLKINKLIYQFVKKFNQLKLLCEKAIDSINYPLTDNTWFGIKYSLPLYYSKTIVLQRQHTVTRAKSTGSLFMCIKRKRTSTNTSQLLQRRINSKKTKIAFIKLFGRLPQKQLPKSRTCYGPTIKAYQQRKIILLIFLTPITQNNRSNWQHLITQLLLLKAKESSGNASF